MNRYKEIVEILNNNNKTVSTMESCTGGMVANTITNVEGASLVFRFGAVTYSNEYKIKMGVDKSVIDNYSVYSMETAKEMSKKISDFTNSNYGIGITGKLGVIDKNNMYGLDNMVYISIYDKDNDNYINQTVSIESKNREEAKKQVVTIVGYKLLNELKKQS